MFDMLDSSTKVVIETALKWDISVEVLDPKENIVRLTQNDNVVIVKEGVLTSHTSAIAREITDNKQLTKNILSENGFITPKGSQFFSYEEALENFSQYKNKDIVIKPNFGRKGIGISIINSDDNNKIKVDIKRAFEEKSDVLIEEHSPGNDYRFLVIGNKVIGIIHRIPANIVGNGIDTIEELIRQKNELRLKTILRECLIQTGSAEIEILEEKNRTLSSIPNKGEKVFLRRNSNISTGGDCVEASTDVHDYYKEIAVKAVQLFHLPICGLDMLLTTPEEKGSYTIIELNSVPGISLHNIPTIGKSVNAGKAFLNFLGFHDPREPSITQSQP